MFNALIVSIAEGVIISCGKNLFGKISLWLKKGKIKEELETKLCSMINSKHGDEIYFNSLDSFLTEERFSKKIISYCFQPAESPFNSINAYINYLSIKFTDKKPEYLYVKSRIFQDLLSLSKVIFEIINDYTGNETARLVITNLGDKFDEQLAQLSQQNEKIYNLLSERLPKTDNTTVDFDNQDSINLYKASLVSRYVNHTHYLSRNIYTENDTAQTSVQCLLKDKRIVLLGEPGSGKTYEAVNLLKVVCTDADFEKYIPIYMNLVEYGVAHNSISEYIQKQLKNYFGIISEEKITQILATDKLVIILDGVDEITQEDNRVKFYADINQLLSYTNAYYYITSRTNPYHRNIDNIVEYKIESLTEEQICAELQKNGVNIDIDKQYKALFSNPLFLQIGIKVLKTSSGKIYNKSQLFNAYIEEVCYKRDQKKQLAKRVETNYYKMLMSIGDLAFNTFEKTFLSIAEFDEFFGSKDKDYTTNNICDVFRIDIFKIGENIMFSHKQFKEYFAAYYLVKKYNVNENRELYYSLMKNEIWQEVMVFAAGLIADIDNQNMFLDMILESNLRTYLDCLKHKNDLSDSYAKLSHQEYARTYLKTLYDSYTLLIESYFANIHKQFPPFKSKEESRENNKKMCLIGSMTEDRKHLHFWFDWMDISEETVQLYDKSDMPAAFKDMEKRAIMEGRNIITQGVNLERSNLMGDSARQVAINIAYDSIKKILEKYRLYESDYIMYEKLCSQTKNIKLLRDKSIAEIAEWATDYVRKTYEAFDSSNGATLAGIHYNKVDVINLMNIANYLDTRNGTHESLALPQPDLPLTSGWIWDVYSNERVQERLRAFFLWRQISFHEMVENNFPRMKDYFPLCKDYPYRYRIHLKYKDTDEYASRPSITYYHICVKDDEDKTPEIITTEPYPNINNEEIFNLIMSSYSSNGKEIESFSVAESGFDLTLTSHHSGSNMPLASVVYDDLKSNFKKLFEK